MKLFSLSLLFIIPLVLLGGHSSGQHRKVTPKVVSDKWQKLSDKAGHFKIEMPGVPIRQVDTTEPHDPSWMFVDKQTRIVYMIRWGSRQLVGASAEKDLLQDETKHLQASMPVPGTKISKREIFLAGHEGIEFKFQASYSTQRMKVVVIQGFEYILIVGTPKTVSKNIESANAERFFKSFSIIFSIR